MTIMMNRKRLSRIWIAVLVLFAAGPASAQVGLLEIYQRALQNDPLLRQAEADYLATAQVRPQARSNLLPSLSFGQTGAQNPFIESTEFQSNNLNVTLSLNQTVFDWSRYLTLKQADKTVARAETDFATAQQDLIIRVAETYFNVLAAEDTLASQIAARESIARQLEQAQRRFDVGLIAITDVQETQAGFDSAVAAEIAAERSLATAQEFLREIINEYVTELRSPGEDLPLLRPDPENIEEWVRTAEEQNLALVSSRIGVDIAQDDIDIQRAARFPTINFQAGYQDSTNRNDQFNNLVPGVTPPPGLIIDPFPTAQRGDGYNWSFNFNVPIYTGGGTRSRVQQSVYRARSAIETLERIARQTERQARDAYLGVISEISRVQALRQALESSQTALRATEAGFEVGTRTSVDVLTSQNNLRSAETNYARSRYDYILNVLRLKQAAGSLAETDIVEVESWLE
jgi:outer membrane protein